MGMNKRRVLLYPFALIYGGITSIRNKFFDWGVLPTYKIQLPSIGVGNLSIGGTGKSVVVDYLISNFKKDFRILKGVQIADEKSTAATIGDEPFQFYSKYQDIEVVVAEKRILGLKKIEKLPSKFDLLILDDILQHRYVKPTTLVLTTTYDAPYVSDALLPSGNLRESKSGAQRADIVMVTKCPEKLTVQQIKFFKERLNLLPQQKIFFTKIKYSSTVQNTLTKKGLTKLKSPFVLVTGIADSTPLVSHLNSLGLDFIHLSFSDHHQFTTQDIKKLKKVQGGGDILTTEKDYTRLHPVLQDENLFYLPIDMAFLDAAMEQEFKAYLKEKIKLN
jgi:tetraacyldisaccharide 4'-kinase